MGADCHDDDPACVAGGARSTLPHPGGGTSIATAGRGLHVLYVDGYNAGAFGTYSLNASRP